MVASAQNARVAQLDTLRGAAALLVFVLHLGQFHARAADPFDALLSLQQWLDLGRTGVVVFFLISGFVMPGSFAGTGVQAGALFVRRRFFRLYPAFWISLAAAIAVSVFLTGGVDGPAPTLPIAAANATMAPSLFGQKQIVGIFWTLEIELLFYALLLCIYLFMQLNGARAALLAFAFMGLAAAYAALGRAMGWAERAPLDDRLFQGLIHLSLMFGGSALRFHWMTQAQPRYAGAPALTQLYFLLWLAGLGGAALLQARSEGLTPGALHFSLTYGAAILTFLAVLRFAKGGPIGAYFGDRSYSIYLFHVVVLAAMAWLAYVAPELGLHSFALFAAASFALTLAVAHAVYEYVERPAMALGRGRRTTMHRAPA